MRWTRPPSWSISTGRVRRARRSSRNARVSARNCSRSPTLRLKRIRPQGSFSRKKARSSPLEREARAAADEGLRHAAPISPRSLRPLRSLGDEALAALALEARAERRGVRLGQADHPQAVDRLAVDGRPCGRRSPTPLRADAYLALSRATVALGLRLGFGRGELNGPAAGRVAAVASTGGCASGAVELRPLGDSPALGLLRSAFPAWRCWLGEASRRVALGRGGVGLGDHDAGRRFRGQLGRAVRSSASTAAGAGRIARRFGPAPAWPASPLARCRLAGSRAGRRAHWRRRSAFRRAASERCAPASDRETATPCGGGGRGRRDERRVDGGGDCGPSRPAPARRIGAAADGGGLAEPLAGGCRAGLRAQIDRLLLGIDDLDRRRLGVVLEQGRAGVAGGGDGFVARRLRPWSDPAPRR